MHGEACIPHNLRPESFRQRLQVDGPVIKRHRGAFDRVGVLLVASGFSGFPKLTAELMLPLLQIALRNLRISTCHSSPGQAAVWFFADSAAAAHCLNASMSF